MGRSLRYFKRKALEGLDVRLMYDSLDQIIFDLVENMKS